MINFTKLHLTLVKEIEFWGLVINSVNMMLALPLEKVLDIQNKCVQLIGSPNTTIMKLTKLLGKLSFTAQAMLPGRIQCKYASSGRQKNKFLSNQKKIKPTVTGRLEVVEVEFTSSERQTTERRNATVNHPNACFEKRLGGSLSGKHHGGNLVISEKDKIYECAGAPCSESRNINFYPGKISNSNPLTYRKHGSCLTCFKWGELC